MEERKDYNFRTMSYSGGKIRIKYYIHAREDFTRSSNLAGLMYNVIKDNFKGNRIVEVIKITVDETITGITELSNALKIMFKSIGHNSIVYIGENAFDMETIERFINTLCASEYINGFKTNNINILKINTIYSMLGLANIGSFPVVNSDVYIHPNDAGSLLIARHIINEIY